MSQLSIEQQKLLFTEARSHHAWLPEPVSEAQLKALYDLGKWGPTSANTNPARLVFLRTPAARDRLVPALMGSNVEQVRTSAVTVIVAHDLEFYEKLPELMPAIPDARSWFAGNDAAIQSTAFRNSSLQGAYFMLAARALGLDVCPMSGFDNAKVDAEFFKGAKAKWRSNFIFTLGHGDQAKLYPRGPRIAFEEACQVL